VAKSELGTKRICPETGRKFYDLGKDPVISPYTGQVVPIAPPPTSRGRPDAAAAAARAKPPVEEEAVVPETAEAEFVSLEEADAEATTGKKGAEGEVVEGADEIEVDETLDDAAFIEEQEEGDEDVTDIIGDVADEEET
jgi:uncharacterized protein (TIGR02300 family)